MGEFPNWQSGCGRIRIWYACATCLSSAKTLPVESVILLVEDCEADAMLMKRAWRSLNLQNPLQVVTDGEQAINYLEGFGQFADRAAHPLPTLVLLDLKMPIISGFEVLRWIRSSPDLKAVTVIVLTNSVYEDEMKLAYQLGANSFMVKPPNFDRLLVELEAIVRYWSTFYRAPSSTTVGTASQPPPDASID
jgi:CheY-like chemotaxis protein